MIRIPLTQGKVALVDDCDAHLAEMKWFCDSGGYAKRNTAPVDGKRLFVFLHHAVIGRPLFRLDVDHRNGNRLDCRRLNLRIVTRRENASNKPCHRGDAKRSSRFIGVNFHVRDKKWQAQIRINSKRISLGYFDSEEKAGNAYREALCRA